RGDDSLCHSLRRPDAIAAPGTAMGLLLVASLSRHHGSLATVPQSPCLGCLCRRHLFHRLSSILVSRSGAGSGDSARSRQKSLAEKNLRILRPRLASLRHALATPPNSLPVACRAGP